MAQFSKFLQLLNGLPVTQDLASNELAVNELRVGGTSGTLLTQTLLDNLLGLEAELASTANGEGASKIGVEAVPTNYTPGSADVEAHLAGIDSALAAAGTDELVKISANDTTAGYLEDKIVVSEGTNSTEALEISTLNDGADEDLQIQFDESKVTIASSQISDKGAANGVASLDANAKIPSSQLPAIAITEVFVVADIAARDALTVGSGDGEVQEGDVVRVTDASADPGITSGAASYIYDGSAYVLLKVGDEVLSVNGETGAVVLDSDDIAEGASNLYHTDERAQDAVGTILDDSDSVDFTYDDATPGISATVLQSPAVRKSVTVDEAFAADTSFLVRYALDGETAGRVLKADSASAAANEEFYAVAVLQSAGAALTAGETVTATFLGSHALGSSDTPFAAADIGKPVYLTDAGAFSTTPPADAGDAVYRIGIVETTTSIWVDGKQLNGIVA